MVIALRQTQAALADAGDDHRVVLRVLLRHKNEGHAYDAAVKRRDLHLQSYAALITVMRAASIAA